MFKWSFEASGANRVVYLKDFLGLFIILPTVLQTIHFGHNELMISYPDVTNGS